MFLIHTLCQKLAPWHHQARSIQAFLFNPVIISSLAFISSRCFFCPSANTIDLSAFDHVLTSSIDRLSIFVHATRIFSALNCEITRSLMLTNSTRKPCMILQRSLSSFIICLAYLCAAYCHADSDRSFQLIEQYIS